MTTRVELLRVMPAFGGLQPNSLELILHESTDVLVSKGEHFFREGDPGDALFVLEVGSVVVVRDGECVELGRLATGDCFGEMSLLDFQPRSASVRADVDCQAIRVPSKALRTLYRENIQEYAIIMMNLGREVSRRLRITGDRLFELHQHSLDATR